MRSSIFLVASLVVSAASAAPPARVEIAYDVLRDGGRIAEVVMRFEHEGGRYRVLETWKGRGVYSLAGGIVRSSHGTVGPAGLRPLEFTDERSRRAPSRAQFDWPARMLTTERKGRTQQQPLPADAQDRLSFLLALAFAPPGAQPAVFSVTDGGGLSIYVYEAVARERVKILYGELDALKVARRPDGPEDRRTTEIWLAPLLGDLPVRILFTDKDGSRIDQQAARITVP